VREALALAALLLAALGLRLSIAWDGLEDVLLRATSDDAFYYLQIAREWTGGAPPSLDGETPTNGFHPLWLWLCALAWQLAGEPVAALRVVLSLGAVFGTATTALVWATLRRLGAPAVAALLAAAFHGLHPYFAVEAVNGLESALAVFCIALLTWRFVIVARDARPLSVRQGAILGAAAGAMLLARTDTVFVWAAIGAFLAARAARSGGWAGVAAAAGVSALLLAPWLVWSAASLGGVVQVSGYALSEPPRRAFLETHGDSLDVVLGRSAFLLRDAFLQKLFRTYFVPAGWPAWPAWLGALAAAGALLFALPEPERRRARRRLALLAVPGAGIVLALAWHAGVRWWLREWYFAPAGWLGVLLLGVALASAAECVGRVAPPRRRLAAALATGTAALAMAAVLAPGDGTRWGTQTPHRVTQLEGARWIDANLPPDARLGAFNAGILSYFSGRTVVNLDGAVNADAYAARRDGRMMDYILSRQLDYLVDWQGYLAWAGCRDHPAARCTRAESLGLPHEGFGPGPLLLVRVDLRGAQ
jgi:hypothetical protein